MPPIPESDTIAAISTPPGRGGIGIVRLAGPEAFAVAGKLVRLARPLEHAQARFVRVLDPRNQAGAGNTETIDEAIVTAFRGPHSYTGDDVVEIAAHGAPVVLHAILDEALRHGARLAEPGEFTQRAFLSGRLDLTQVEAVQDLIAAQTLEQARAAAQQLGGALSRRLAPAKEELVQLIALLEAGMDFASGELDDVEVVAPEEIARVVTSVQEFLSKLARSFQVGSLLRNGLTLALVGRPNAGKSSLFNRLLERPRAIVTPVAGTTRDTVEETWSLKGIPVRLVDTAGLRTHGEAPVDEAEREGMERSRAVFHDADLVVLVHDATVPVSEDEFALAQELKGRPHLLVRNKVDLLDEADRLKAQEQGPGASMLPVSALNGQGIEVLQESMLKVLNATGAVGETGALNNRRQQEAVSAALQSLQQANKANQAGLPHEVLLVDLHNGLQALDSVTGTTTTEDILGRIFSTFCIGK